MNKEKADKIKAVRAEREFCKIKITQLTAELEALTSIKGELTPMAKLGLSTRPYNALGRAGYVGIEQLLAIEDIHDLLYTCRNFGEKSLNEVKQKLAKWAQGALEAP